MRWRSFIKWILLLKTRIGPFLARAEARVNSGAQQWPPLRRTCCHHRLSQSLGAWWGLSVSLDVDLSFSLSPSPASFSWSPPSLYLSHLPSASFSASLPLGASASLLLSQSLCLWLSLWISDCNFVSLLLTRFSVSLSDVVWLFFLFSPVFFPPFFLCLSLFLYIFLSASPPLSFSL